MKTVENKSVSLIAILTMTCLLLPNLADGQDQPAKLSPVKLRILNNRVVPSMAAANQQEMYVLVSSLFNTATDAEIKLIDQFFEEKGFGAATDFYASTTVGQILSGSFQGQPTETQSKILDQYLQGQLTTRLNAVKQRQSDLQTQPLPTDWAKSEELFYQLYVQHNNIDSTIRLVEFATRLLGPAQNKAADQLAELKTAKANLLKTEAKFRLKQLETAATKLETATDFGDKFKSLMQINSAETFYTHFFENYSDGFADKDLAAEFRDNVNAKILAAKTGHESIVEKVALFQTGLEWWFRGRYGAGQQAAGLLKPLHAMQNRESMLNLKLPIKRPSPPDKIVFTSLSAPQRPEYFERRHHYNWKIGHRERLAEGSGVLNRKGFAQVDKTKQTCAGLITNRETRAVSVRTYDFDKIFDDTSIVPRLVGSYEYLNSLESLEDLVEKSNPDELAVYDELVSVRPDLSINVGLAKAYGGDRVSFDASMVVFKPPTTNAVKTNTRKGLAWLMALARVELGASLSAYTDEEKPFEKLTPTEFDRRQFEVILYDDAMMHLLALDDDRDFQAVTRKNSKANLMSLDYWRRLKMVRNMVDMAFHSQLNDRKRQEVFEIAKRKLKRKAQSLLDSIEIRIAQIEQREFTKGAVGLADRRTQDMKIIAAGFLKDATSFSESTQQIKPSTQ